MLVFLCHMFEQWQSTIGWYFLFDLDTTSELKPMILLSMKYPDIDSFYLSCPRENAAAMQAVKYMNLSCRRYLNIIAKTNLVRRNNLSSVVSYKWMRTTRLKWLGWFHRRSQTTTWAYFSMTWTGKLFQLDLLD
jgi:hypothetical protein